MAEPVPGISAVPDEQNARYFHVVVTGETRDVLSNYNSNRPVTQKRLVVISQLNTADHLKEIYLSAPAES